MALKKTIQVRLSLYHSQALNGIAMYLSTDLSSVIRMMIDDAISTLSLWTNLEIATEDKKEKEEEKYGKR